MAAVLSTLRMDPAIAAVALTVVVSGNVMAAVLAGSFWIDGLRKRRYR